MAITIKMIAKRANVSIATVSRYFSSPSSLTKKTRERVEAVVNEYNYRPNFAASILKSNLTNTVGILVPDTNNIFYNRLIDELNVTLNKNGKHLLIFYNDPNINFDTQINSFLTIKVDALLFVPNSYSDNTYQLLSESKCYPLQLFVDYYHDFDSVVVDDEKGTYIATKELINNGHQRILFIDYNNDIFVHRLAGFKGALNDNVFKFDNDMVLALKLNDMENYAKQIGERIISYKPTAIISVTNNLTQLTCTVLRKLNLQIHKDISLIMYDESEWAKIEGITTIAQSHALLTKQISNLIIDMYDSSKTKSHHKIIVSPTLNRRTSIKDISNK